MLLDHFIAHIKILADDQPIYVFPGDIYFKILRMWILNRMLHGNMTWRAFDCIFNIFTRYRCAHFGWSILMILRRHHKYRVVLRIGFAQLPICRESLVLFAYVIVDACARIDACFLHFISAGYIVALTRSWF